MRAHALTNGRSARGRRPLRGAVLLTCLAVLTSAAPRPASGQGSLFSLGGGQKAEPLVLVVHGMGGGNRDDGWSSSMQKTWNISEVREITFRNERHDQTSNTDAMYYAGDWALDVQRQIKDAVAQNPGRPVVIVSHSWGTVATSMALGGGSGGGKTRELGLQANQINPIDLGGARIAGWITLGSPIGASTLPLLNVDVSDRRPSMVDHWTNFYDVDDPVSKASHNLQGADNIEVFGSAGNIVSRALDFFGLGAHTGIWTNPAVTRFVQSSVAKARSTPVTTRTQNTSSRPVPPSTPTTRTQPPLTRSVPSPGGPTAPSSAADYSAVCQSAMTAIERHFQKLYGAEFKRITWTPPFRYDNGDCVGGYTLWAQKPGQPEWAPLIWNADTGTGRVPVQNLIQQYSRDNPDLTWTARGGTTSRPVPDGTPNYAQTCQSAMTAIERHFASLYGPEFVRVEWTFPFRYDNGSCTGGYNVWAKRLSDNQQYTPLIWNADTGAGRVGLQQLIQEYAAKNPDLTWVAPGR